jgi:carbonic anhydrase
VTKKIKTIICICFLLASCRQQHSKPENSPGEKNPAKQEHAMINSPDDAIAELKAENKRFIEGNMVNTNYKEQIEHTKSDQHPHSLILSCLDSRIPPEIIFDQGIGNIFAGRIAGNVEDPNILGSMEFAAKLKGVKLIV